MSFWIDERASLMSEASTAVENRAIFIPKKRWRPGNREKKPSRVVGKQRPCCLRHTFFVTDEKLSHPRVCQNTRRYCRRQALAMSSLQRFSCFNEVVRQIKSFGFRLNCGWMTLYETHGPPLNPRLNPSNLRHNNGCLSHQYVKMTVLNMQ